MRGVLRRRADADLIRVQDVGLAGAEDPDVLAWAAQNNRILLTHDVATITKYAYGRIQAGLPMPGVFEISQAVPVGIAIADLVLLIEYSTQDEWEGQVRYLPLSQ